MLAPGPATSVAGRGGSAPGARASAGGRDARYHVVVGPGLPAERPAGWCCCLGALAATIPPGRGAGPAASPPFRHRVRKPQADPATAQVCSAPDHQEWPAAFAGVAARHWGRAVARRRDPERSEPVSGVSSELKSDVLMRISTVEKTRNPPNSSARCAQPFFNGTTNLMATTVACYLGNRTYQPMRAQQRPRKLDKIVAA